VGTKIISFGIIKHFKEKLNMSAQVLIKRGLKVNLPATATEGEPLFTTDTKEFFVGTGSGVKKISDVEYSTSAPTDLTLLWVDTTNNVIKRNWRW
jgi:hypothetical protein